jgi:hypothetical protein
MSPPKIKVDVEVGGPSEIVQPGNLKGLATVTIILIGYFNRGDYLIDI